VLHQKKCGGGAAAAITFSEARFDGGANRFAPSMRHQKWGDGANHDGLI
jgi:hypothetical protein